MATFTPPTYERPAPGRMGELGFFTNVIGFAVWVRDSDGEVQQQAEWVHDDLAIMRDSDYSGPGYGGEHGKMLWHSGKTYEVSAAEETILTNAGYTVQGGGT